MAVTLETFTGAAFCAGPDYPALFQRYVLRTVTLLVGRVRAGERRLPVDVREQAWHVLNYSLELDATWPSTRELLLTLAPQMEREGLRHEWLPYLERGVVRSRALHDAAAEAHLARYVGRLYRLAGEYGTAQGWFERAVAQARAAGERRSEAQALNQLGYVARLQRRHDDARAYVQAALARLDDDDVERATSYSWLAAVAYDLLDWPAAARHYQTAHDMWQAAGDRQRAAWSLQNLGDTLRSAGKLDAAAQTIGASIRLLGELNDPLNQAIGRMNLGIVHLIQEQYEEAMALFNLAEAVFVRVQDPLQQAKVYHNMAMAERGLGHCHAAEQVSRQAIRLWEKLGDRKLMVNSMDELGLAVEGQGRKQEALDIYRAGLRVLDELPPDAFRDMLRDMLLEHFDTPPDLT